MKRAMIVSLLACAVVGGARPCAAESKLSVDIASACYLVAASADSISTYAGQQAGQVREVNPMYSWQSPKAAIVTGLAVDAIVVASTRHFAKRHKALAIVAISIGTAARLFATAETLAIMRRASAGR